MFNEICFQKSKPLLNKGSFKSLESLCGCMWSGTDEQGTVHIRMHPENLPNWEFQIPRYLAAQIHMQILVQFEFLPRNFREPLWLYTEWHRRAGHNILMYRYENKSGPTKPKKEKNRIFWRA